MNTAKEYEYEPGSSGLRRAEVESYELRVERSENAAAIPADWDRSPQLAVGTTALPGAMRKSLVLVGIGGNLSDLVGEKSFFVTFGGFFFCKGVE